MRIAKRIGVAIGLGGAVAGALATTAVATCPIAQGAVVGGLGALGLSHCAPSEFRPLLYVAAAVSGALFIYAAARVRRRRNDVEPQGS